MPTELQKWTRAGRKRLQRLVIAEILKQVCRLRVLILLPIINKSKRLESLLGKIEVLAPILGSFSGLTGILTGQGPIQWALVVVMVLATITAIGMSVYQMREEYS
ncbi:hypothetical protein O9A_00017 [Bartonella koehlerae C-29]|uniref:Uncharacterized protein n=1 Tax=Bartonella koehlerae C-29 TaxID=1134510 RepID=A0A067WID4_9HYPH|nr:hypothetical protein O9A_00017 [Bartonella koehlerae C-29]